MTTHKNEEWNDMDGLYPWWIVPKNSGVEVLGIEKDRGDKE